MPMINHLIDHAALESFSCTYVRYINTWYRYQGKTLNIQWSALLELQGALLLEKAPIVRKLKVTLLRNWYR